jgi:hypothetical protein
MFTYRFVIDWPVFWNCFKELIVIPRRRCFFSSVDDATFQNILVLQTLHSYSLRRNPRLEELGIDGIKY